jgi:hypothetical protein
MGWARRVIPAFFAGVLMFGLTGCYTQLAVVDHTERYPDVVHVEERDGETVVNRYYYDDPYYADPFDPYFHRPMMYSRFFGQFYMDPFYVAFYDPFFWGSARFFHPVYASPWHASRFYYAPGYSVYWPYYGGWRYDAPHVIRRPHGLYEPRGSMGRGALATVGRTAPRGDNDAAGRGANIGRTYDGNYIGRAGVSRQGAAGTGAGAVGAPDRGAREGARTIGRTDQTGRDRGTNVRGEAGGRGDVGRVRGEDGSATVRPGQDTARPEGVRTAPRPVPDGRAVNPRSQVTRETPDRPEARPSPERTTEPAARPTPQRSTEPAARPAPRSTEPAARPAPRGNEPAARPAPARSSGETREAPPERRSEPAARPAPPPERRSEPAARTPPSQQRSEPAARPAPAQRSQPAARPAPAQRSQPAARPAPSSSGSSERSRSRGGRSGDED